MIFLYLISSLASTDVRNAECRVACRYIGYQTGSYSHNLCYCMDAFDYEKTVGYKKTVLPKRVSSMSDNILKW